MLFIQRVLKKTLDILGVICSFLVFLMLLNVFYDVLMRYLFNDVSIAMQELEWHLFAAMFMFGIAYTLKEDGHVRVDIIYSQLSDRYRAIVNIVSCTCFIIPLGCLLLYFGWGYTLDAYEIGEGSADPGGLPYRFIIRGVIPLSSCFLLLSALYVLIENFKNLGAQAGGAKWKV